MVIFITGGVCKINAQTRELVKIKTKNDRKCADGLTRDRDVVSDEILSMKWFPQCKKMIIYK